MQSIMTCHPMKKPNLTFTTHCPSYLLLPSHSLKTPIFLNPSDNTTLESVSRISSPINNNNHNQEASKPNPRANEQNYRLGSNAFAQSQSISLWVKESTWNLIIKKSQGFESFPLVGTQVAQINSSSFSHNLSFFWGPKSPCRFHTSSTSK